MVELCSSALSAYSTLLLPVCYSLYPIYTIEQTSSKRRANVFKIHVLIARRLLDVCSMFARRLLDVC